MSYSDFTLQSAIKTFQLLVNERDSLFTHTAPVPLSEHFSAILRENVPLALAINTEKARSELIIAALLVELRKMLQYQISFFSGVEFHVDPQRGLNGICDFLLTRSPEQFFISAPAIIIVEAKNESIKGGLGQCIATMLAAQVFHAQENQPIAPVYGAVTSGSVWKFLTLFDRTVGIDLDEYHISNASKILGILMHMVEEVYASFPNS